MSSRAILQQSLNRIEADLPRLLAECPDPADFWPEFAGAADEITEAAGEHDDWVAEKIDAMLSFHGLTANDKA